MVSCTSYAADVSFHRRKATTQIKYEYACFWDHIGALVAHNPLVRHGDGPPEALQHIVTRRGPGGGDVVEYVLRGHADELEVDGVCTTAYEDVELSLSEDAL